MVCRNTYRGVLLTLCMAVVISGCASISTHPLADKHPGSRVTLCEQLIHSLDGLVQATNVADQGSRRIKQFPFLRTNRFLTSFNEQIETAEQFNQLVGYLRQQALQGWHFEVNNLGKEKSVELLPLVAQLGNDSISVALDECSQLLVESSFNRQNNRERLLANNRVPDAYSNWQRILGLYPLVSPIFKLGILQWHDETRATHAKERSALPIIGKLVHYHDHQGPEEHEEASGKQPPGIMSNNPLGIPEPGKKTLQALFNAHAPVFEIDTVNQHDLIGSIRLDENAGVEVDTSKPAYYQYTTRTRIDDEILLQLNYMIWFPSRPKSSSVDLLGGKLDGIIWRVTLLPDGSPLLYDSIHTCGCYHLVFPTQHAKVKTNQAGYEEPLLILDPVQIGDDQRLFVRVASTTHYINNVYTSNRTLKNAITVAIQHKDRLRSLPAGQRHASLYDGDAIITDSVRLERFLFWPMGVISPGAMRQPGHHATAFIGRRHFDDAYLFAPYLGINGGVSR